MKSRISVILAAYHGEKYIGEQLESISRQTRLPDEILIGDDSRNDATHQVVESFRHQYPGTLRYIRNPEQLGFVKNFINLAEHAAGDMIFFSDQDDVWFPEKIETLVSELEKRPNIQLLVCNSELVDEDMNSLGETSFSGVKDLSRKLDEINVGKGFFYLINGKICCSGHNMVMRKTFLPVLEQMPASFFSHDHWLQCSAGFFNAIYICERKLTKHRRHKRNVSVFLKLSVKQNLWRRFQEIWNSSEDVFFVANTLKDFVLFTDAYPENPNRPLLLEYSRYFSWRAELLQKPRWKRLLILFSSIPRLGDHYRYGFGTRSMIRDLIVRADAPREKEQQAK